MKKQFLLLLLATLNVCSGPEYTNPVFMVVNELDLKKCGITLSKMGEGISGFAVLSKRRVAVGYDSLLLIVDSAGIVTTRLAFKDFVAHFDLDSNGTGIAAVNDSLYGVNDLIADKKGFRPLFSVEGMTRGMFRMDLLAGDSIRIISLSPDFVVEGACENIRTMQPAVQTFMDSCLIDKITEFAGFYKGKALFLEPNYGGNAKGASYDLVFFSIDSNRLRAEDSRTRIFDAGFGDFMLLAYPCRYSGGDFFHVMFKRKNKALIVKVNLNEVVD